MISLAMWITSDEARIFKFTPNGVESHRMHKHGPKHAHETQGRNHPQKGGDADHFFHEVAEHLGKEKADHWLIVGPGLAKTHFKGHVESHHAQLAKKIIGVESMDKATDGEITNFAHDFFKKQGLYQGL